MRAKSINFLLLIFSAVSPLLFAQYPNIRVSRPESRRPEEVTIAINPANPDNLLAGANINFYYYSMDGGRSWTEGRLSSTFGVWGDPCVVFDGAGNAYYGHLSNPADGYWIDRIVVQKSADGGRTWNDGAGVGLNPPKNQDKEWLAVDLTESPHRNSIHMAWTEFDTYGSASPWDSSRVLFSSSRDAGITWSDPVRVSDRGGDARDDDNTVEGAVPAVGPDGEIYLSWSGHGNIYFDRSLDGGKTFGVDRIVAEQPGGWNFDVPGISRCNGLPVTTCDVSHSPYRGTVYIMWSDQRNGEEDTDVFLIKSRDGGVSWSAPLRVNTDAPGRHQFFPWMAVDQSTGRIYIVFYDRRNTTGNATDVYLAVSADGGEHFIDFRISENAFTPVASVFFGDYINVAALDARVYPIWMRMDGTNLSVWTALVEDTLTAVAESHEPAAPSRFALLQNYPNPFNAGTVIQYEVPHAARVSVIVYDALGRKVRTLVRAEKAPGRYRLFWTGTDAQNRPVASGVFLLQLEAGDFVKVKKIVSLR